MDKIAKALSGKKGLVVYITAGFPNYEKCEQAILAAIEKGADVVEIGLPFSDPLADGPVLQKASAEAIANGATTKKTLQLVRDLRAQTQVPLLIMGYINPIYAYGLEKFAQEAKAAGLDGLVLPDVPEEESLLVEDVFKKYGLSRIHFVAPTSGVERIKEICEKADTGFIYCLARTGVTGTGKGIDEGSAELIKIARERAKLPLAMGFGITDPASAKEAVRDADAAIVGSAVVEKLRQGGPAAVGEFVASLRNELDLCEV